MLTDLRIKIYNFFKDNQFQVILLILFGILGTSIFSAIKNININVNPEVILSKSVPVMDGVVAFPEKITGRGEKKIEKFLELIDENKLDEAVEMISKDNKKYGFSSKEEAIGYVKTVFQNKKRDIVAYSKIDNVYVYQVKVFEDILATGLTENEFSYYDAKMAIIDNGNDLDLNIRGFIQRKNIDGLYEDNNVKVRLLNKNEWFETEEYEFEVTNRTRDYLVIKDYASKVGAQASITVGTSGRKTSETSIIALTPLETRKYKLRFPKKYDIDKETESINFDSVRIIKDYKAVQNGGINYEDENIKNTINQFQIQIKIEEK